MKNIKKLLSIILVLALCLTSVALADDAIPSIDDVIARRIDMTEYSVETYTEEDELDRAIREAMGDRVDLTDQPGTHYGEDALEEFIRMLLGIAVPVGNTITTIHECQTGYFSSDQKIVKVTVALTIDVIKSALPKGASGQINTRAQNYINSLISSGKFQGGSSNRNVEYALDAIESVVGSVSSDTADLVRRLGSAAATILSI